MSESFSPVIFLYGMALLGAVNKVGTLFIRRSLSIQGRVCNTRSWRHAAAEKPAKVLSVTALTPPVI